MVIFNLDIFVVNNSFNETIKLFNLLREIKIKIFNFLEQSLFEDKRNYLKIEFYNTFFLLFLENSKNLSPSILVYFFIFTYFYSPYLYLILQSNCWKNYQHKTPLQFEEHVTLVCSIYINYYFLTTFPISLSDKENCA